VLIRGEETATVEHPELFLIGAVLVAELAEFVVVGGQPLD
jgi:hypothetical protein